jgi:hypothetical protein
MKYSDNVRGCHEDAVKPKLENYEMGKYNSPMYYEVGFQYATGTAPSEDHLGSISANYYKIFAWEENESD